MDSQNLGALVAATGFWLIIAVAMLTPTKPSDSQWALKRSEEVRSMRVARPVPRSIITRAEAREQH
jgi:hypothetical protein